MNTTERAQEVAHGSPHTLDGVDMHFPDAITVVIACPFTRAVTDGSPRANDMIVATPFIGIDLRPGCRKLMDMSAQGFLVSMVYDAQAHFTALASDSSHNRRSVIVISPVSSAFVSPSARWIIGIGVSFAFFPPRSETVHPFQSVGRVASFRVGSVRHWPGLPSVWRVPFAGSPRSHARWQPMAPLCIPLAAVTRFALAGSASLQISSHCTHCRCFDIHCTDKPATDFSLSSETRAPPPRPFRSAGISTHRDGSVLAATICSAHRPVKSQLESPC